MRLLEDKDKCFGCSACSMACPKTAIEMIADEKGFLYPTINNSKCINCGICERVCQIDREKRYLNPIPIESYGIKNTDKVRLASSSGGVYSLISSYIINNNGVCFGVRFDEHMNVVFDKACLDRERDLFRGSKYVTPLHNDVYKKVGVYLKLGTKVLFTGSSCQVAGLLFYLDEKNINRNNLLTIDMLCHGMPSHKVWKDYIAFLEELEKSKVVEYRFRDKSQGWRGLQVFARLKDDRVIKNSAYLNSYSTLFNRDVIIRPSCFECPFCKKERIGDITIGDFWGIEKIDSEFDDSKGVSLMMINTPKGEKIFNNLSPCIPELRKYGTSLINQPNLTSPTSKAPFYSYFWRLYNKKGYSAVIKRWAFCDNKIKLFCYKLIDAIRYMFKRK